MKQGDALDKFDQRAARSALWLALLHLYMGRRRTLPPDLDADALDVLLALDIAHFEGRILAATEIGLSLGMTRSTGLRKVQHLVDCRYIDRSTDPLDARRALLCLSPRGLALVQGAYHKLFMQMEGEDFLLDDR